MLTIITDLESREVVSTNALLNIAHRLLNEYRDEPTFNTVELVRHKAGFRGATLSVRLTRMYDGKIRETWGLAPLHDLPNTTKTS